MRAYHSPDNGYHDEEELRVLVVTGDALAGAGLVAILRDLPGISARSTRPHRADFSDSDVIVWDCGANGSDRPADLLVDAPGRIPILALTDEAEAAEQLLAYGVGGVLRRNAEPGELGAAIAAVDRGLIVVERSFLPSTPPAPQPAPIEQLTPREIEVIRLLADGLPNRIIAEQLGISEHTAKFHVNAIIGKLGAHNRTEAVTRAARSGLIDL